MVIILFGVAGSGKTLIGRLLATKLGWAFYDADDFHLPAHIEQMRQGIPLTDRDRQPWLDRLSQLIQEHLHKNQSMVLACSGLKEVYRQQLKQSDAVKLVYLKGDPALIADRLQQRQGHFMNPALLQSQFDALEQPPPDTLIVDVSLPPEAIVQEICRSLDGSSQQQPG